MMAGSDGVVAACVAVPLGRLAESSTTRSLAGKISSSLAGGLPDVCSLLGVHPARSATVHAQTQTHAQQPDMPRPERGFIRFLT
jgi:hypothetical protein